MIIVTGANGKLGRAVVERLLERMPAGQLGVSVRDPEKAQPLEARGVRVRQGDFDNPESLAYAFEGASQVLIVSANSTGETAVRLNTTAIHSAKQAGAKKVLYTSHMGASPTSLFPPMPVHAATESALQDAGVAFTSLRNGFYTATTLQMLGSAAETGELAAPEDGPVSWTTHVDLAEVAAIALTDGGLDGITPPLTSLETVDLEGVAALVSELTGRPVRRVVVPDAEYRAGLLARGVPEGATDMLMGLFLASRQGEFARTDPTLERLLSRPTISVRDVLKEALVPTG